MELNINLHELIELKEALLQKKHRVTKEVKKTDKGMSDLLDADSLETIDTLLNKLDVLFKEI